jgi:beta-mannanase
MPKLVKRVGLLTFGLLAIGLITLQVMPISSLQAKSGLIQQVPIVSCVNGLPTVKLSWKAKTGTAYYAVERKLMLSGPWSGLLATNLSGTTFTDSLWNANYTPGSYLYRVRAIANNSRKTVTYSNTATVTIPACKNSPSTAATSPTTPAPAVAPPVQTPAVIPAPTTPTTTTPSTQTTTPTNVAGKMPSGVRWGAYTGWGDSTMTDFESLTGKKPQLDMVFVHWGNENTFPAYYAKRIRDQGRTMVLFWEASDFTKDPLQQPNYSLDAILNGNFDSYLTTFAQGAKAYGGSVILIPFSEMNGNWYNWSGTVGNNSPAKVIAAYRYVHSFFTDVPNVKFGWAPNNDSVPDTAANQIEKYYPGSDVVDYVGLDGFNFGGSQEQTFSQMFSKPIEILKQYNKPIYIFSMATGSSTNKANWIKTALTVDLYKYPEVVGWLWFNQNKERDWRVNSDSQALNAFISALP